MMKMKEKTMPLKMLKISLSLKSFMLFLRSVMLIIPFFVLQAQEPAIFMLHDIYDNTIQRFSLQNKTSLMCKPYGVRTLDEIFQAKKTSEFCRKKMQNFYEHHPKARFFVHTVMRERAFYHVETKKDGRCIVSVRGLRSYSEMLLNDGLAVVEKQFRDKEFRYRFEDAVKAAKSLKKGIYSDNAVFQCVLSNY